MHRLVKDSANLSELVAYIKADQGHEQDVPGFDPLNGNERARYLLLLEAPGPQAVASGIISFDNSDPTAANLRKQLADAGIRREDVVLWNVVPWYLGDLVNIRSATREDILCGMRYLAPLLRLLPELRCIVLLGKKAREAHVFLSCLTHARILAGHHTSLRGQLRLYAHDENVRVFRMMADCASGIQHE
jgi:hypothetical protein